MKNLRLLPFFFSALILFCQPLSAQTVLHNEDVVSLVNSGLSEAVIAAKIKASDAKFDVSTSALKALSDAKVPDSIVVAMLEKDQKQNEESNLSRKDTDKSLSAIPEQGTLADLAASKKVYILTDNSKSRDIIVKELGKAKGFEVVDKIEDSDFVVKYEESVEEVGASGSVYGNSASVRRVTQKVGLMNVVMPSRDGKRLRHCIQFGKQSISFGKIIPPRVRQGNL